MNGRFTLQIELGNEAMQTMQDVQLRLRMYADRIGRFAHGQIKDRNGNTVGSWSYITDHDHGQVL